MKLAGFALAVAALLMAVPEAQAAGSRGGLAVRSSGGSMGGARFHHSHSHTRVFIGGSFFFWPGPYSYPYPYYAYPAAEAEPPLMVDPYWYYCEESQAYYPYVKDCAGGWLPVLPSSAPTG